MSGGVLWWLLLTVQRTEEEEGIEYTAMHSEHTLSYQSRQEKHNLGSLKAHVGGIGLLSLVGFNCQKLL